MDLLNKFMKYVTGSILALIVGFITTPIITRLFSPEEMGKYSMVVTIGGLISSFLYLGLDQSFVRFFYEEDEDGRAILLKKCILLPLISVMIFSIFLIIFKDKFTFFIIGKNSINFILVFIIYLICLVCNRFTLLNIRMKQKATLYSILNVLRKIFYVVFTIIFYLTLFKEDCFSLIYGVVLAEVLLLFMSIFSEIKDYLVIIKNKIKYKDNISYNKIIKYGIPFVFSASITYIFQSTDKFMLKILSDYSQIGIYSGALNIVHLLTQVQVVFTTFWIPVAMEHYVNKPNDKEFFVKVNEIVSYVMLICAIFLMLSKDIIVMFLGSSYREAAFVFPFLVFMPIMYTISETTVIGINLHKKSSYHIWISAITAIFNIIGNFILISIFGAKGAAISTGLAYIVFFILRTMLSNKCYKVKYKLLKFYISTIIVYCFAIYASFFSVNIMFVLIAISISFIISLFYLDIIRIGLSVSKEIFINELRKLKIKGERFDGK